MNESTMRQHFQRSLAVAGQCWRRSIALRGLFALIAGLALAAALAIPYMDASHFAQVSVGIARALVYALLLALLLIFIVARVPRSRDRRRLVEHLESHPSGRVGDVARDTLLLTAVQMDDRGVDAPLEQRLYERAAAVCDDPGGRTSADRNDARRAARALVGLGALLAIILFVLGDGARHGVKLLLMPWRDAQQSMPYRIDVQPGDTVVRERADVAIRGTARGFAPQALTLVHRAQGARSWTRTPMQTVRQADAQLPASGAFQSDLVAVRGPFEYYLEGDNVRSPTHRVRVHWLPHAQRIDHIYHYPSYTGIADRRVESATDIDAVTGSIVEVRVLADVRSDRHSPAAQVRGDLVLDNSTRRALVRDGDMLSASLSVDEAASYRIELRAESGVEVDDKMVPVTPDHGITARADGAPVVKVRRPASDARVTAIEEITVQLHADDDVSLRQVELVYSINGRSEEVVALTPEPAAMLANATGPPSVSASHTLYLEQFDLKPGDVISYHGRASDGVVLRTAVSDIQFLEVRPFDRDYRRGRSGGAGGRNQESLAAQQRDLVVALFRLARDSQQLPGEEQAQRLTTLSDAQGRIRGRVEAIVRRIEGRAVVQNTPGYVLMLEVMPKAITAMARVEALLTVPDAEQSLPFAREALVHLQRADASFREVQVASQRGRGGSGGSRMNNNDLSRLFELEMDRFRNRYSQVQRAQAPQRQREVDETLDKLKELARRQREEVERARRRAQRAPRGGADANSASPGSSAASVATQQALAAALDELLRRLGRLSRERPSASMDAAREAMQQAAQSMRESMRAQQNAQTQTQTQARSAMPSDQPDATQQGGQSRKHKGGQHSDGAEVAQAGTEARGSSGERSARDALRRLDAARQALSADGRDQISREVRQAQQRVQSLLRRQAQIAQQLSDDGRSQAVAQGARKARDEQSMRLAQAQGQASARDLSAEDAHSDPATGRKRTDRAIDARSGDRGDADANGEDDRGRSVDELKALMQVDAQKLREQLDRIASAKDTRAPVRGAARRAGEVMREEDVEGRLRFSREQLAAGQSYGTLEASIAQALERVREQIARAADATAQGGERRVAQAASQRGLRPNEPRKNAQREGQNGGQNGGQNVSQGNAQSSGQGPQQPAGQGGGGGRGQGQVASPGEGQISGPRSGDTSMPNAERLREMMREMARLRERFERGLGAGPGPGGRGRDDLRGLASELRQFEAGQLEAQASNFERAGDLRTLIEGIEALAAQADAARELRGAQVSDALLAALARVERRVKDRAEAGRASVPTGRDARMPREYRALVEAYYRRLSAAEPRR